MTSNSCYLDLIKLILPEYKDSLSSFKEWKEKKHAKRYLIFPQNIRPYLSLDETALSHGILYTIIINEQAKGRKGSIMSIMAETKVDPVIK